MPILYFGGSFNPIHHGHLLCSRAVAEAGGFDRIVLIPSAQPPHKHDQAALASSSARLAMCRLAVTGSSMFEVDDRELLRDGPSYTLDTAQSLKDRHGTRPFWLIGADMLLQLPSWHRPLELLQAVHFVVMARPGWTLDWQKLPPEYHHLQTHVVEAPQVDISATEIRRRVAAGKSIEFFSPPVVCQYITAQGLYR